MDLLRRVHFIHEQKRPPPTPPRLRSLKQQEQQTEKHPSQAKTGCPQTQPSSNDGVINSAG